MSKKSLKILLILVTILSLISTFSLATDTNATSTNNDNEAVVTSDDGNNNAVTTSDDSTTSTNDNSGQTTSSEATSNNDVYLNGDDVTIDTSETINGNAFVVAKTLTVRGQIGGDLFAIAETLNIDGGQIYGNVFALSNNITLNGLIYDLYASCENLTVSYDGVAYRDLKVICKKASINGVVGKNVNILARDSVTIESDGLIYGDFNYSAKSEATINGSDIIKGTTNYTPSTTGTKALSYFIAGLSVLVYTLIIWLLMSKFAPKFYGKVKDMPIKKVLISILVGLLAVIVVPLVSILLMLTVIGVPVAISLIALLAVICSISFAILSINLSNKLAEKVKVLSKFNNLFAVIIVTIVLWILTLIPIPYFKAILVAIYTLAGLGMFLFSVINKKDKKVEVKE